MALNGIQSLQAQLYPALQMTPSQVNTAAVGSEVGTALRQNTPPALRIDANTRPEEIPSLVGGTFDISA